MPTVTVVVPCYKYGSFVTECVTSVLANQDVDLDILVVDDASPDDSWSVVEQLPRLDSRIRVHRNDQNQGLIGTANAAIMAATGDYVVLLSADDALTPGWLDRGVAYLEDHPSAVLAYGPTRRFAGALPSLHLKRRVQASVSAGRAWIEQVCVQGVTPMLSPEVIVRTSSQHEVGGYQPDLPYSSDMEMWLRLASIGDIARISGPVAAFYRVAAQSMSRGVYVDLLKELEVRRDAFDVWYKFAECRVADRNDLLKLAKNSLARRAVRRAYLAFLQDPVYGQFDSVCEFALDCDSEWSGPEVERLRRLPQRASTVRLRQSMIPITKVGARARHTAADVRARLHII